MMDEQIRKLDDASVLRMLGVITEAHQGRTKETPPSRENRRVCNFVAHAALGGL